MKQSKPYQAIGSTVFYLIKENVIDSMDYSKEKSGIWEVSCKDCHQKYIGQTSSIQLRGSQPPLVGLYLAKLTTLIQNSL